MGRVNIKLNLVVCWALAVFECSNSKIYSEAAYWKKTIGATDTHKFSFLFNNFFCCIKPHTPLVLLASFFQK